MALYIRSEAVPPVSLLLLCLSKRLHSIFMLRLFNDCMAVFIANLAIWLLLDRRWRLSLLAFSIAVSVKMNVLLLAPPVLVVVMQARHLWICLSSLHFPIQYGPANSSMSHYPQESSPTRYFVHQHGRNIS